MITKFLLLFACLFLLTSLTKIAFAYPLNCPPASAISHQPHQLWQLSPNYTAQGWQVDSYFVKDVSETSLPPDALAEVNIYDTQAINDGSVPIACSYEVDNQGDRLTVFQASGATISHQELVEITQYNPWFQFTIDNNVIACNAQNDDVNRHCEWKFQKNY